MDATREDVSNWINADEITKGIRAIPARHVLVVSDSCYAGTMPHVFGAPPAGASERERLLQRMAAGRSRTLMASGGAEPLADDDDSGLSVLAVALLRGLRRMQGPRFTASELFTDHVLGPVASRSGRIPAYNPLHNSGHESGDFVLTRIKPPAAPGSCDDLEEKEKHYQAFLDYFKGNAEAQKTAYEFARNYISRYGSCPDEGDRKASDYVRKWMGKYEEAVRLWEESQRRQGRRP